MVLSCSRWLPRPIRWLEMDFMAAIDLRCGRLGVSLFEESRLREVKLKLGPA